MSVISPNQREGITAIDSISGNNFYVKGTSATGAINVNVSGSSVTGDVNLTEVGGVAISLGQTTMTASLPVTIASNQSAVPVSQSGTWNINNISGTISLPTGAATLAEQQTQSSTLSTINGKIPSGLTVTSTRLLVDGSGVTQPISAASLPLPSGAATSANQTNGSQLTQIVDAGGDAVTVTGGKLDVNATISGSGGGTSSIDDAPFAVGSDTGTPAMGLLDDVAPDSVDEGDVGVLRMSANRVLYNQIRDAAGNERGVNVTASNALKVDGSAVTQPVTGSGTAGTAASGVITVQGIASMTPVQVSQATASSLNATVVGPAADGAAVSGNPVRIAGKDGSGNTQDVLTDTSGRINNLIGTVSSANSRANANLGAASTYTGTFEDITQYTGFSLGILDAGASGGVLTINWSEDGVNIRDTDSVTVPTANGQQFVWGRKWQYFQVSYTHSGGAGNVVIQSILHTTNIIPSTHFGTDTITTGQDGQLVVSANRLLNGSTFFNQLGDSNGNAQIVGTAAHDAPVSGAPILQGGYASAAAPSDVSGDGDAVRAWYLRNGARAIQPTYAGVLATTGNGASGTGVARVTIANDSTGVVGLNAGTNSIGKISDITTSVVPGTTATNLGKAEDAAHTTGDTGVFVLSVRTDTQVSSAGTTGDYATFPTDANGAQYVTPAASAGSVGTAIYNNTALSSTKQAVNASAGNLYGYHVYNPNAVVIYIQLFNLASASVTVGTTAPTAVIAVPPLGWADATPATPISFSTALTIAATTTSTGSSAPTTALLFNCWYK